MSDEIKNENVENLEVKDLEVKSLDTEKVNEAEEIEEMEAEVIEETEVIDIEEVESEVVEAEVVETEIVEETVEDVNLQRGIPRTKLEDNKITGDINGYPIKGLVYGDKRLIISIPVEFEVFQDVLDRVEYPEFISDVRYQNGKIDLLSDVREFRLLEGEKTIESLTEELIKEGIPADLDYKEQRIEKVELFWPKVIGIFVLNIVAGIAFASVIFQFQLGKMLTSSGDFTVSYYSHFMYIALIIGLMFVNNKLFDSFKMVNRYNKKSNSKMEIINFVIILITATVSVYFDLMNNGMQLLGLTFSQALINVDYIWLMFDAAGTDYLMIFIMNILSAGMGVLFVGAKTIGSLRSGRK